MCCSLPFRLCLRLKDLESWQCSKTVIIFDERLTHCGWNTSTGEWWRWWRQRREGEALQGAEARLDVPGRWFVVDYWLVVGWSLSSSSTWFLLDHLCAMSCWFQAIFKQFLHPFWSNTFQMWQETSSWGCRLTSGEQLMSSAQIQVFPPVPTSWRCGFVWKWGISPSMAIVLYCARENYYLNLF